MYKVLLNFGLSWLRQFRNLEYYCLVGLSGLDSAVEKYRLKVLRRPHGLLISFLILEPEVCDSPTPCFPSFFINDFSLKSRHSSSYLFPFLPPTLLCISVTLKGGNLHFLHQQQRQWVSEQVRSSTPLHRFLSSLFLSSASYPDSSCSCFRHSHRRHGDGPQDFPGGHTGAAAAAADNAKPCWWVDLLIKNFRTLVLLEKFF